MLDCKFFFRIRMRRSCRSASVYSVLKQALPRESTWRTEVPRALQWPGHDVTLPLLSPRAILDVRCVISPLANLIHWQWLPEHHETASLRLWFTTSGHIHHTYSLKQYKNCLSYRALRKSLTCPSPLALIPWLDDTSPISLLVTCLCGGLCA